MPHAIPYLGFKGTCAEAMHFYEGALGAKIELMLRGADTPMAAQIPKGSPDFIAHARLALPDGGKIYAGDMPDSMPYEGMKGISITLDYASVAEAEKVFAALASGGQVNMPIQPAFWAQVCGIVTDKFGTPWIVNGGLIDIKEAGA